MKNVSCLQELSAPPGVVRPLQSLGHVVKNDTHIQKWTSFQAQTTSRNGIRLCLVLFVWGSRAEDEPKASESIGCIFTTGSLVLLKRQRPLSDQEPRTAASQPAINRSWATSKAL